MTRIPLLPALAVSAALAVPAAVPAVAASPVKYEAYLTTKSEVPKTTGKGTGTAKFTLTGRSLSYTLTAKGLSGKPQAAHIHLGKPGVAGEVIVPLATKPFSLPLKGKVTVKSSVVKALKAGTTYVNIHTKKHPAGEIRGQIKKGD